jgi:hypothetical protein
MAAYYYDMLPMSYEQPLQQPNWIASALAFQTAIMFLVLTTLIMCYACDTAEKQEELKRVAERLEALEYDQQDLAPILEITHETPAAGARGRAGRTVSHLRIHRNPYARAD